MITNELNNYLKKTLFLWTKCLILFIQITTYLCWVYVAICRYKYTSLSLNLHLKCIQSLRRVLRFIKSRRLEFTCTTFPRNFVKGRTRHFLGIFVWICGVWGGKNMFFGANNIGRVDIETYHIQSRLRDCSKAHREVYI